MMSKVDDEKIKQANCPECGPKRWADIVGHDVTKGDEGGIWWQTDYYILKCRGCETRYFIEEHVFSEDMEEVYDHDLQEWVGHLPPRIKQYPSPIKRAEPAWSATISIRDSLLGSLLSDIYSCLSADLAVPAAISIRTCFDRASELLGVDAAKTFGEKLNDLKSSGKISEDEAEALAALTEAGSAAAHRAWRPSWAQLSVMMDILESFLHRTLVLAKEAAALGASVPPKPKRTKKKKP